MAQFGVTSPVRHVVVGSPAPVDDESATSAVTRDGRRVSVGDAKDVVSSAIQAKSGPSGQPGTADCKRSTDEPSLLSREVRFIDIVPAEAPPTVCIAQGVTVRVHTVSRNPPPALKLNLNRVPGQSESDYRLHLPERLQDQLEWYVRNQLKHEDGPVRHGFFIRYALRALNQRIADNRITDGDMRAFAQQLSTRFGEYRKQQANAVEWMTRFMASLASDPDSALPLLDRLIGPSVAGLTERGQALFRKVMADRQSNDPARIQAMTQVRNYCANLLLQRAMNDSGLDRSLEVAPDQPTLARLLCQGFDETAAYIRTHGTGGQLHRSLGPAPGLAQRSVHWLGCLGYEAKKSSVVLSFKLKQVLARFFGCLSCRRDAAGQPNAQTSPSQPTLDERIQAIAREQEQHEWNYLTSGPNEIQRKQFFKNDRTKLGIDGLAQASGRLSAVADLEDRVRRLGLHRCRRVHDHLAELRGLLTTTATDPRFADRLRDVQAEIALLEQTRERMDAVLETQANQMMRHANRGTSWEMEDDIEEAEPQTGPRDMTRDEKTSDVRDKKAGAAPQANQIMADPNRPSLKGLDPLSRLRLESLGRRSRALAPFSLWTRNMPLARHWRVGEPSNRRQELMNELFTMAVDMPLTDEQRKAMRLGLKLPETGDLKPDQLRQLLEHRVGLPQVKALALNSVLARIQFDQRQLNQEERRFREVELVRLRDRLLVLSWRLKSDRPGERDLQQVLAHAKENLEAAEANRTSSEFVSLFNSAAEGLNQIEKRVAGVGDLARWIAKSEPKAGPYATLFEWQNRLAFLVNEVLKGSSPSSAPVATALKALARHGSSEEVDKAALFQFTLDCLTWLRMNNFHEGTRGFAAFQALEPQQQKKLLIRAIHETASVINRRPLTRDLPGRKEPQPPAQRPQPPAIEPQSKAAASAAGWPWAATTALPDRTD